MNINTPFISDPTQLEYLFEQSRGEMKHTLMNDFLSKYSFQKDICALRGLLAALLRIDIEDITDITILNPIEPGNNLSEKECILDINLEMNHSKKINIEIQARFQDYWPERSITYLCRNFDNLKSGESYNLVKPCIHIGILSNDLFKKGDPRYTGDFYSEYRLLHTDKHTEYSSKFEIRVLSLSQLENASHEDKENPNGLYRWAKLFLASSWEELKMAAQDNTVMTSFVGTVMQLSAEEKVAQACEARRRWSNDVATYEEEIETAKQARAEVERQLSVTGQQLSEAKDKLATAEDKLATAKDKLATAKDRLATAEDKLATAEDKLVATEDKLATAEDKLATTEDKLTATESKLDDANNEIEELKKQIEILKKGK